MQISRPGWNYYNLFDGPDTASVFHKAVFEVAYNRGTITITIPDNTEITPATGSEIDITQLVAQAKLISAISGLPDGTEVLGAAELGLPNIGLNFDKPIEIKIFVGTGLNGQTLNIRRSISGTSDWTTEGFYLSSNCTVAEGYCTFQTVKTSTFVAAKIPLTSASPRILPETGKNSD